MGAASLQGYRPFNQAASVALEESRTTSQVLRSPSLSTIQAINAALFLTKFLQCYTFWNVFGILTVVIVAVDFVSADYCYDYLRNLVLLHL